MIDIRKLKELVRLMVENDLSELDLQDQSETVTIKRGPGELPVVRHEAAAPANVEPTAPAPAAPAPTTGGEGGGQSVPVAESSDNGLVAVSSPMVGTFYAAPSPDDEPFVKAGSRITPDSVVCMIEAMKVFNEIKAEMAGTIESVFVGNGDAVEFGQKLFAVKPA
jgi:acetyl-CoA carboxylase biotin carboxyl carrier protein